MFNLLRRRRRGTSARLVAIVLLLPIASAAQAAPGGIDRTFSGDGRVITSLSSLDHTSEVAFHRGRTVVVGQTLGPRGEDIAVLRYTAAGALDRTFSGDGVALVSNTSLDTAGAVIMQGDKILVGGGAHPATRGPFLLARLNPNGSPDRTFSGDGKATLAVGSAGEIRAIALQGDRIVVAGHRRERPLGDFQPGNASDVVVARFNSDGSLDTTFGTGGRTIVSQSDHEFVEGVAVMADGRIVVGGQAILGSGTDYVAMRFTADGQLDPTFSDDGIATIDAGPNDFAQALHVRADGRVIVAGMTSVTARRSHARIVQWTADGVADTTFGGTGVVTTPAVDQFSDLVEYPDGRILAVGRAKRSGQFDMAVARYRTDGALDPTFSGDGIAHVEFGQEDMAVAAAFAQPGRLVLAGEVIPRGAARGTKYALARIFI